MLLNARIIFITLITFLSYQCLMGSNASANQANPNPISEKQPDGSIISITVKGDEHFNWNEDKNGYTIVRENGWYFYATRANNGRLIATKHIVGRVNPKALGIAKGIMPSPKVQAENIKNVTYSPTFNNKSISTTPSNRSTQTTSPQGIIKNLVVMLRFANHSNRVLPLQSDFDILFNSPTPVSGIAPTGSVKAVFLENSYGQLILNSGVQDWVLLSQTESYYANGVSGDQTLWEGIREALSILDQTIDFRDYDVDRDGKIDAITFIHSGYGAEWGGTDVDGAAQADRIWSHRWSLQSTAWTSEEGVMVNDYHISPSLWGRSGGKIGRIGVIAHETGHFFGLPDLYDTNGGGSGIGSYGLMANSWDFNGSQYCPPHLSPWSKIQLGWTTPQTVNGAGEYNLSIAAFNADVLKVTQGFNSGEYLLIENRQNGGFDCSMPQGGVAIWHIDESASYNNEGYPGQFRWPENGRHYRVALLQADGRYDLEKGVNRGDAGDVYHGGGNNYIGEGPGGHPNTDTYQNGNISQTGITVDSISNSASTMTLCINGCTNNNEGLQAPSNLIASIEKIGRGKNAEKVISLTWQDNSTNEDNFLVERCKESGKGKNKTCVFSTISTTEANVTSYSDSPGSGTFKYRVKAVNSTEESEYTNEIKV